MLLRLLRSAVRVPDQGRRDPPRFPRSGGDARPTRPEMRARRAMQPHPGASDAVLDKERGRFTHAPVVVAVVAVLGPDDSIPESERFSTAACACFALLQAAQSFGFGAQWLTGWAAYDPAIAATLDLAPTERVLGFIHIGVAADPAPERVRPDPRTLLTDLTL